MAATVVIGIPELLREIASHIYAPTSLSQLCLVTHTFKAAFTPRLYRCLVWDESNIKFLADPDSRRCLLKDNKLAYTKIFIIARSGLEALQSAWNAENSRKDMRWRHSGHHHFTGLETIWTLLNDAIVEICQHAHRLQTFASQGIAIYSNSLAALSSIPSLRNISIEFHEDMKILDVYTDMDMPEQSLNKLSDTEEQYTFAGLRKLSLLLLYGNIKAWRGQILKIILNSPDLEFLALSLSPSGVYEPEDETGGAEPTDLSLKTDTFQWLSRQYAKATGRSLQFESTKFHYGIIPNVVVLEGWVGPNGVDTVYVWNEDNGPFLKGLEVFPMSDIGPQLLVDDGATIVKQFQRNFT